MVVAGIEVQALLDRDVPRDVLPAIPVEAVCGRRQGLCEAPDLLGLIVAPRRVAGFGDPDLGAGVVPVDDCGISLRCRS